MYASVQLCIKTNGFHHSFAICIRHLHQIFDPILPLFCNVKLCQRANVGPRYPPKVRTAFNSLHGHFNGHSNKSRYWTVWVKIVLNYNQQDDVERLI